MRAKVTLTKNYQHPIRNDYLEEGKTFSGVKKKQLQLQLGFFWGVGSDF